MRPVELTFQVLSTSRNSKSIDLLVHAIQSPVAEIRALAARAMISIPNTRCKMELIRHLDKIPDGVSDAMRGKSADFETAIKQALGHGDDIIIQNAIEAMRLTESYNMISELLQVLESPNQYLGDCAEETIRFMVDRLYEHTQFSKGGAAVDSYLRDTPKIQYKVLSALEKACQNIDQVSRPDVIVDSILILGDIQSVVVKKILTQSSSKLGEIISNALHESTHPGVMNLTYELISQKTPYFHALGAVQLRTDPEFLTHFLRALPKNPPQALKKNLLLIESIDWIDELDCHIDTIPPQLHPYVITLIQCSGIDDELKTKWQQWILQHGSAEGREAVSSQMSRGNPEKLKEVVLDGLESEDREVQIWATSQLRKSHVPDAMQILVNSLDSDDAAIQEVARKELRGFNVEKTIELCEVTEPATCQRLGTLLLKINPNAIAELSQEMAQPIRSKRIQAATATFKMNLHERAIPALLSLLHDADAFVRRTAIEILQTIDHPQVITEIQNMLTDPNDRVQEAAEKAFSIIQSRSSTSKKQGVPV